MKTQQTIQGIHALQQIGALPEFSARRRIFAVLDEPAYRASGADAILAPLFADHAVTRFSQFTTNPQMEEVLAGLEEYRSAQSELFLAVGGGTAIDIAKLISAMAHSNHPQKVLNGQETLSSRGIPLIAIPTTAGTGSEATQFAVVYMNGEKYSLDHPCLLPDISILDPTLSLSLPAHITAATGLDALCQAIESIWSVGATEESVDWACEAVALAYGHLYEATHHATLQAREAMCRAAHLAGKAINITRTTACHALSYSMTSRYGLPHGIAVSLTLAPLLKFNAELNDKDCADSRGAEHVRQRINRIVESLGADNVPQACQKILQLLSDLNCPTSLAEAGIVSPEQVQQIVQSVNLQRLANNPRTATAENLFELLYESLPAVAEI